MLNSREITNFQESGELWVYSSFTLAELVRSLNSAGIDLENVKITPKSLAIHIQMV